MAGFKWKVAASVPGDPSFSLNSMLFHFNGTNGQTTGITDVMGKATPTLFGGAALSTTAPKFGAASLALASSGDYVTFPASSEYNWIVGAKFTIEFWIKTSTSTVDTQYRRVMAFGGDAANNIQFLFFDGSGASTNLSVYSSSMLITGNIAVADGAWHHVALSGTVGTSLKLFVDGVQSGSTYTGGAAQALNAGNSTALTLGKYPGANGQMIGNIDDLRITATDRYTTGFTAPTAAFPDA